MQPLDEETPVEVEITVRRSQKQESNTVIWFKPLGKFRFSIPLCRLRCLPIVRPINDVDVSRLENEFMMGYRDGDRAMYVSIYNNLDEVFHVSDDMKSSWSPLWQEANSEFEAILQSDSDLSIFVDKMFYVLERNHRLTAWWRHINNHHRWTKIGISLLIVLWWIQEIAPPSSLMLRMTSTGELDILCSFSSVLVFLIFSSNIFFD